MAVEVITRLNEETGLPKLEGVIFENKTGRFAITADVIIDATADIDLVWRAIGNDGCRMVSMKERIGAGFFGGEGFILQRLRGDGMAFIHAGGTIVKKSLKNSSLRVDTGCLVAFTRGINYDIAKAGNLKSMFFGGEGLFLATLSGTGTVLLQSLPFSRMADRILQHAPSAGGSRKGEGSILGTIGGLIDGDNR